MNMRKKKATERFGLKVLAFLVTVLSFCTLVIGSVGIAFAVEEGIYTEWLYANRYTLIFLGIVCVLLCILSFIFQMCSAGRVYPREHVEAKGIAAMPFDLAAGFLVAMVVVFLTVINRLTYVYWTYAVTLITCIIVFFCLFLGFCLIWAIQCKAGIWWKNTVICRVLSAVSKAVKFFAVGGRAVFRNLPRLVTAGIGLAAFYLAELLLLILWGGDLQDFASLWMMEQVLLIPAVLYLALASGRLHKGSAALVEGNLSAKIDTRFMIGSFKEQGENLNRLAQALNVIVEERMKSERMKTELITNVSHDIKTPLTSIINYADLIVEEPTENGKITEYAEVLKRQSARLKKLIEDLMEASKASTGNMEVHMVPCELDVFLTQTAGEYTQRLAELDLELIIRQPGKPVTVMADGKLLWRVFDNLLNNICKYAMPGTRVYLSVQEKAGEAVIAFKNTSKYPLDISPEELQERFVRGDRSRHTEGNGLGLSIARSLTELQGGRLEITVDGDFFKAEIILKS